MFVHNHIKATLPYLDPDRPRVRVRLQPRGAHLGEGADGAVALPGLHPRVHKRRVRTEVRLDAGALHLLEEFPGHLRLPGLGAGLMV